MREIKFRAFYKELNAIFEVAEIIFDEDEVLISVVDSHDKETGIMCVGYGEIELMQYTGLKDKNGVYIYEGDIVEINIPFSYEDDDFIVKIAWRLKKFVVKYKDQSFKPIRLEDCIVIGNIYENPKLLN